MTNVSDTQDKNGEGVENPYIGPRTFIEEEGDRFFGREREARDLLSLVIANRLVLFYAQSGAGKSSLLNTRLIPQLRQERFVVLPTGRVSGGLPSGMNQIKNIFALNLMLSLDQSHGELGQFANLTLSDFLARLTTRDGRYFYYSDIFSKPASANPTAYTPPHVLIIDQFEEIITTHPNRWSDQADFFRQLDQVLLADPQLWVVLTLREDYVAALDPYAPLVPSRMQTRFYMQQLGYEAALEAVKKPAARFGRPFTEGVAEILVDNLRLINIPGSDTPQPGQFVEPVQLQVVCYQLWQNLQGQPFGEITEQDLQELGDIDVALAGLYEQAIQKTLQQFNQHYLASSAEAGTDTAASNSFGQYGPLSEINLRNWFDRELITETGTRGTVYQGPEETAGLPNQAVKLLADQYLVRAELRAGGTWYELVHDRFVEPILQANRAWWERQTPLLRAARTWQESEYDENKLYLGVQLQELLTSLGSRQPEPLVAEFLAECQAAEQARLEKELMQQRELAATQKLAEEQRQRAEEQTKAVQRLHLLLTGLVIVFMIAVAAAIWAWTQQAHAEASRAEAETARSTAVAAKATAETGQMIAEEQTRLTLSRQLAAQALNNLSFYDRALLLGVGANQTADTVEAKSVLLEALESYPKLTVFRHEHTNRVWSVAFSPDGHLLVSADEDGQIILWDIATRQPFSQLPTAANAVYSVAFSPNGKILAVGNADSTITFWDTATHQPFGQPLWGHKPGGVMYVTFSPNGQLLASASLDNTIILWDMATRQPIGPPLTGHTDWVWKVAFSPDGKTLASVGRDQRVILWDVATRQPLGSPLTGHKNTVASVAFSPDGRTLATGDGHGRIILWDVATHLPLGQPLTQHVNTVWGLVFKSDDPKILISSSEDGSIIIWDTVTHQPIDTLVGQSDFASSLALSPKDQTLASGTRDAKIILWDLSAFQRLSHSLPRPPQASEIWSVAFSPHPLDNSTDLTLAAGRRDGLVILWEQVNRQPISSTLKGHHAGINSVAFSQNGQILASASDDGTVILWDVAARQQLGQLTTGSGAIFGLAFSPDDKILASAGHDKIIRLWDVATQQLLGQLIGHIDIVQSVVFSPDGKTLASGSYDKTIRLWDVATQQLLGQLIGHINTKHTNWIGTLAFSPDGHTLASGGFDSRIILWDIATRRPIGDSLTEHKRFVHKVAFSPDGRILASASADKTIIVWDIATRQRLGQPLSGHTDRIRSIAFSPDGQTLASASVDGTIRLWDAGLEAWQKRACGIANRNLTLTEWKQYFGEAPYRRICPAWPIDASVVEVGLEKAVAGDIKGAVEQIQQILAPGTSSEVELEAQLQQLAAQSLVVKSSKLAQEADLKGAIEQFEQALALNPNLGFDPEVKAHQVAAQTLVGQARRTAEAGDIKGAIAQFEAALKLNPDLVLQPETEARQIAAQALVKAGQQSIQNGNNESALAQFNEALALDSTLKLAPETEIRAQALLEQGQKLANQGRIAQAVTAYQQAQKADPAFKISANAWEALCRLGSQQRYARQVIFACEKAVALAPEAGWAHDSRGMARALTEDYEGAIEDYRFVLNLLNENNLYQHDARHEVWVLLLEAGRSPFETSMRKIPR